MAGAAVGMIPLLVAGGSGEARDSLVAGLGGLGVVEACPTSDEAARRAAGGPAIIVHVGPLPEGSPLAAPPLHVRTIVAGGPPVSAPGVRHLPDPVDTAALSREVAEARRELAAREEPTPPFPHLPWLGPPLLPPALAPLVPVATRAGHAAVPVTIVGGPGSGGAMLARDLHRASRRTARLVRLDGRDGAALSGALRAREGAPPTVILDGVERMPCAAQQELLGALERRRRDRPWVIAICPDDPRAHAARGEIAPSLAARLAALVLRLPPLAARGADLPALAGALLGEIGEQLGRDLVLSPEAIERLARQLWPGGLAELEAAVERTALACPRSEIAAEDLWLDPGTVPGSSEAELPPAPPAPDHLELLLAELAHELKNPLVTVKTFAEHLPDLLADASLRERFAALTDEAIHRMDDLLDNVLGYARLGSPEPRPVDLGAVLERALAMLGPELAARGLTVQREAPVPAVRCFADAAHLEYAFVNLFRGLFQELAGEREVRLAAGRNGALALRFRAGAGVAEKLRALVGMAREGAGRIGALPLSMSLARAVIVRNGGRLGVGVTRGGETEVVVKLPPAEPAAQVARP